MHEISTRPCKTYSRDAFHFHARVISLINASFAIQYRIFPRVAPRRSPRPDRVSVSTVFTFSRGFLSSQVYDSLGTVAGRFSDFESTEGLEEKPLVIILGTIIETSRTLLCFSAFVANDDLDRSLILARNRAFEVNKRSPSLSRISAWRTDVQWTLVLCIL